MVEGLMIEAKKGPNEQAAPEIKDIVK